MSNSTNRAPRRRQIMPDTWQHISARTIEGRFAFVPVDDTFTARIWGIIGKAQEKYRVQLAGFVMMSNHFHAIVRGPDPQEISRFFQFAKRGFTLLSHEYHGTSGSLWDQPFSNCNVLDDASQLHWMRYLLSHGVKENLVTDPAHWPGANCVAAVCGGGRIKALWLDRKAWAQKPGTPLESHLKPIKVSLTPMLEMKRPAWQHTCRGLRDTVIEAHAGQAVLGAEKARTLKPRHIPKVLKKSRRKTFDARGPESSQLLALAYDARRSGIAAALHALAKLIREGCEGACLPKGFQWTALITAELTKMQMIDERAAAG